MIREKAREQCDSIYKSFLNATNEQSELSGPQYKTMMSILSDMQTGEKSVRQLIVRLSTLAASWEEALLNKQFKMVLSDAKAKEYQTPCPDGGVVLRGKPPGHGLACAVYSIIVLEVGGVSPL